MRCIAARAILSSLVVAPFFLAAQTVPTPASGPKVRFWIVAGGSVHTAQLRDLTADSLILESCATCSTLRYSRAEVNHIEVFRQLPRGMRTLRGYGYGGLIGLVAGAIVAGTCRGIGDTCDGAILAVPIGGIVGGLIGGLVGYLTAYRWDPIG